MQRMGKQLSGWLVRMLQWAAVAAAVAVAAGLALSVALIGFVTGIAGSSQAAAEAVLAACVPDGTAHQGTPGQGQAPGPAVRQQQVSNAKAIDDAAAKAGFPGSASRIAIIAAMGESSLVNLDYGDQVNGQKNPDGSPATSFGLFQQQTSQGWGTKEQVMDPAYATLSFLEGPRHDRKGGLAAVPGWDTNPDASAVIHAIQHNSDANHYTRFIADADGVIAEAHIDIKRAGTQTAAAQTQQTAAGLPAGCVTAAGAASEVKATEGKDDYPFKSIVPPPGIYTEDPFGYYYGECTSFVAWRLNRDAGAVAAPYLYTYRHGYLFGNAATWRNAWLARGWKVSGAPVPGAVAWFAPGSLGVGDSGHVAYVASVTPDGKAVIEEYNDSFYAPPGHRYDTRPQPVDPGQVSAFLYPPPKTN